MIARSDRDIFGATLAQYLSGELNNDDVDSAVLRHCYGCHQDVALQAIGDVVWLNYCDMRTHYVTLSREGWQLFRRCIAFLRTDLGHPVVTEGGRVDPQIWPFLSRRELFAARPNLSDLRLPRYDSLKHAIPLPVLDWVYHVPSIIVLALAIVCLIYRLL